MAFAHSPKIVTDGLVLALDAGNPKSYPGSGTVWRDKSGNGNDGTLMNGPIYRTGSGGSMDFDGVNDHIILTEAVSLPGEFTAQFWFYKNNSLGQQSLSGNTSDSASPGSKILFFNETNLFVRIIAGAAQVNANIGYTSALDGIWQMVSVTRDSSNVIKARLNIASETTIGTLAGTFNQEDIGRNSDGQYLNGNISSVKFYNRALSASEVQQNYNALKGRFGI